MHRVRALVLLALAAPALAADPEGRLPAAGPLCSGEYSDFLNAMRPENRAFEASPEAAYTYCIRDVTTYEHIYYAKGGKIRKQYIRHISHGTGFAYKVKDGEWYLATNQHVVEGPEVTDDDHVVDGVPTGSRKVREVLKIVRNESDDYEAGMIPLTKVLSDEALDVAVVKTRHPLRLMPYRIGHSAALKVGNVVQVRGFPLGVFAAANTGKVISTGQMDHDRAWNHEDFAVDALLNPGNSGSPVFAVSCKTGELELVGIYHAGYTNAQGLNVVISIDQLRDVLENLKVPHHDAMVVGDAPADRVATVAALEKLGAPIIIPFGDRAVRVEVERERGAVKFSLYDADWPLSTRMHLVIVDADKEYSTPSALQLPQRFGDAEIDWDKLDPAVRDPTQKLYDALWRQLAAVLAYRDADAHLKGGPDASAAVAQAAALIRARKPEQRDLLNSMDFESDSIAWPVLSTPDGHAPLAAAPAAPAGGAVVTPIPASPVSGPPARPVSAPPAPTPAPSPAK